MNYKSLVLLPFIDISRHGDINLGSIRYLSADRYKEVFPHKLHSKCEEYFKWFGTFRTFINGKDEQIITDEIDPREMTMILVEEDILKESDKRYNELVEDCINVLFFVSQFNAFIHNSNIEFINPFKFIIGLDPEYIDKGSPWSTQWTYEINRERTVNVNCFDEEILKTLLKLVIEKYTLESAAFSEKILRSIEYYSGRFFNREKGPISMSGNKPEDFVFLTASFESLFTIESNNQKWLELYEKISRLLKFEDVPDSMLRLWVEGFYKMRNDIVHGKKINEAIFSGNPNIKIHYATLGYRLLPYCIKIMLIENKYLEKREFDLSDFSYKDEIENLLWPQYLLLKEIKCLLSLLLKTDNETEFSLKLFEVDKLEKKYTCIYQNQESDENFEIELINDVKISKTIGSILHFLEQNKKIFKKDQALKEYWVSRTNGINRSKIFINSIKKLVS